MIDGPWPTNPPAPRANSAWTVFAAIAHNLLRAAGALAGDRIPAPEAQPYAAASSPSPPGWPAPNDDQYCTCPPTGPGPNNGFYIVATNTIGYSPPLSAPA